MIVAAYALCTSVEGTCMGRGGHRWRCSRAHVQEASGWRDFPYTVAADATWAECKKCGHSHPPAASSEGPSAMSHQVRIKGTAVPLEKRHN
jgi:hypothetical protein